FELSNGNVDAALAALRRAAVLDPRSPITQRSFGGVLLYSGRWDEARAVYERALTLAPGDISVTTALILIELSEGSLPEARRRLNAAEPLGGREALLADLAMFGDLYWLLDPAQQDTVMRLGVEYFADDSTSRAFVHAQILYARGDTAGARRWARDAARGFEAMGERTEDSQVPALVGLCLAYLGRHDEARRWLDRAATKSTREDLPSRMYVHEVTARAMVLAGDEAGALAALERYAEAFGPSSHGRIRVHPEYAPL